MIPLILGALALGGVAIYKIKEEEKQKQEEEKRILASGIYEVDQMSGKEFEKLL